jgi:hypothetical protein
MTENNQYTPSDHDIYSLVDRLRSTGNHFNDDTAAVEHRVPNFHDCHLAADVIESLMVYKYLSARMMEEALSKVIGDE